MPLLLFIIILFVTILLSIIFGLICRKIAISKGHSSGYFWLGFFFDIIGIIITSCIPNLNKEKEEKNQYKALQRQNQLNYGFVKEFWICPDCGTKNPANANYCMECGAESFIKDTKWKCPRCGQMNSPDSKYCGECGYKK